MKFINLIGVSDVFLEGPDMSVTLAQSTSTLDGKKGFFFLRSDKVYRISSFSPKVVH